MTIYSVHDPEFIPYGRVITGLEDAVSEILPALAQIPLPEGTGYVPTEPLLQDLPAADVMRDHCFGGMPVELGWCCGHNRNLNCLEYHRDSEFNLGTEEFILLLARQEEITDGFLDTAKVKAFLVPAGTLIEVYATTLHYAPCCTENTVKIISFGPRPLNFLACNAPIKQLYNLGVEIEENSELDLFEAFNKHAGDPRIAEVAADMAAELGAGNKKPEILEKLAQYELTLLDWIEEHRGYRKYVTIAGKCWPAFQTQFGFVPCYVNSRLTGRGIPVSCEVDIYGALSEYIGTCISQDAVTLLDINNSVPKDMYRESIEGKFPYMHKDTFMGFHCGNTCSRKLSSCEMKYQIIMARALPVEVTNGTLEGDIAPGDITFFRLQSTADSKLRAYVAEGEVLPVATRSFGGIGVFAIHEMGRFYRHVLIEKNYPHHGAVAFGHYGKELFEVFKYIGVPVEDLNYNQPASLPYPTENPFA